MGRNRQGFDSTVKLPPELKIAHVRKAIEYMERETAQFVDVHSRAGR